MSAITEYVRLIVKHPRRKGESLQAWTKRLSVAWAKEGYYQPQAKESAPNKGKEV